MEPAQDPPGRSEQWRKGIQNWRSRVAILVAGYLVFETLSGLVILFAPFSVPSQMTVLVHTAIGLVFLIPCGWYLLRHWLEYFRNPLSHIVVVGYVGTAAFVLCIVSGVVLTVQATWSPRISYAWDAVHIVTTFATLVFCFFHIAPLAVRDRSIPATIPDVKPGASGAYLKGALAWSLAFVVVVVGVSLAYRSPSLTTALPDDYSFVYGPDRPFAPSLGTVTEQVIQFTDTCGKIL